MPKGPQGQTTDPEPVWLHLLSPTQRAWRVKQILKGRDPDYYMEQQLREAKLWPPKERKTEGTDA
jgi:hypothetical protein